MAWDKTNRKNILFQGEDLVAFLFTWLQCTELQCSWFVCKTERTECIEVFKILQIGSYRSDKFNYPKGEIGCWAYFSVDASSARVVLGIMMNTSLSEYSEELRISATWARAAATVVFDILNDGKKVKVRYLLVSHYIHVLRSSIGRAINYLPIAARDSLCT